MASNVHLWWRFVHRSRNDNRLAEIDIITDISFQDVTGFDSSIFVALCEAYELGDYFGLPLLTSGVVATLIEEFGSGLCSLQNKSWDRPQLLTPEYVDDFFKGVARAYANNSPKFLPLQHGFVEFVRRSRYLALTDKAFTSRLKDESCFARDVLMIVVGETIDFSDRLVVPIVFPSVCKTCDRRKAPDRYFAETGLRDGRTWKEGICSSCYADGKRLAQ